MKHQFLDCWRNYQKALRQRNMALRQKEPDDRVKAWDAELVKHGEAVETLRREYLDDFLPLFSSICSDNLTFESICSYKRGWSPNVGFQEALEQSWNRDRAFGSTQVGPHRADLPLEVQDRRARHRVSRGQQKMLGASLVIAQTRYVAGTTQSGQILLVDDPAAELDRDNRERLFRMLQDIPAQMFLTALEREDLPWVKNGKMFHIDDGKVSALL